MALDRQSIEKKDFPIGRRGYDPDAVDSHLAALAAEVEELRRQTRSRTENLASVASEQVRGIVEAAEESAADIQRQAEDQAREIRGDADTEAQRTREQATEQARDYVGQVSEAAGSLLDRVSAMESELGTLVDGLRTGTNRLNADLQLLEGNLGELRDATGAGRRFEPEPGSAPAPSRRAPAAAPVEPQLEAVPEPSLEAVADLEDEPVDEALEPEPLVEEELEVELVEVEIEAEEELADEPALTEELAAEPEPEPAPVNGARAADPEGARLVALNMALNGSSRGETDSYLAEHFELPDRAALLDEVYATVEG